MIESTLDAGSAGLEGLPLRMAHGPSSRGIFLIRENGQFSRRNPLEAGLKGDFP